MDTTNMQVFDLLDFAPNIVDLLGPRSLLSFRATCSCARKRVDSRWATLEELREFVLATHLSHAELCQAVGRCRTIDVLQMYVRIMKVRVEKWSQQPQYMMYRKETDANIRYIPFLAAFVQVFVNCLADYGWIRRVEGYYVEERAGEDEGCNTYTTPRGGNTECFRHVAGTILHGYRVPHADSRGSIPIYFYYPATSLDVSWNTREHEKQPLVAVALSVCQLVSDVCDFLSSSDATIMMNDLEQYYSSKESYIDRLTMQGHLLLHQHQLQRALRTHHAAEERSLGTGARNDSVQDISPRIEQHYLDTWEMARDEISPAHPSRLALATNYSAFLCDVLDKRERGLEFAQSGFNEAVPELDWSGCHDEGREITLQLLALKANLQHWQHAA